MNKIANIIKSNSEKYETVFVFPTQAEAREWFIRSLEITGADTLPEDMFIAWDTFKKRFLASDEKRKPVSQIIRKLFVNDIIKKNNKHKKNGNAIFKKIILEKFSDSSSNLTSWFVSILPQLDNFERKLKNIKIKTNEVTEFLILKTYYEKFLQKHNLYEPSWISERLNLDGENIKIIFPELIEDFFELKPVLEKNNLIEFIHTDILENNNIEAVEFDDSRMEIDFCISKIESLLLNGVLANDIAVTVCNLDELKPYLSREAYLRGIPIEFRSGQMLGQTQAGLLFAQIQNVVAENFSFDSVKQLFSNTHLVWKETELMHQLLKFGIEKNCVASWKDNGKLKNCWEEAFDFYNDAKTKDIFEIESFFKTFKTLSENLVYSKNFTAIKNNYRNFRDAFLVKEKFFIDDDLILSRCIEKLKSLSLLEEEFKSELPENIFSFFISTLDETMYVYKNTGTGISVFNFPVMAISPYTYNFLLNANQKDARADFSNLKFLRNDIRNNIGASDIDAVKYFLKAYYNTQQCFISFAKKTFSEYAMCHNSIQKRKLSLDEEKFLTVNSFSNEEKYFSTNESVINYKPYIIQQLGIKNFLQNFKVREQNNFSFLKNSFNANSLSILDRRLQNFYTDDKFNISATQLKNFYFCPSFYFLETVLGIEKLYETPMLFSPLSAGILSHGIVEKVLRYISQTDNIFVKTHLEDYFKYAEKIIFDDVNNSKLLNGSFSKPFTDIIIQKKISEIKELLNYFADNYSNFAIPVIEKEISIHFKKYNLMGKIDCALNDKKNKFVLADFKSSWTPEPKDCRVSDKDDAVSDFQIAMYVYLLENSFELSTVSDAFFWSLAKKIAVKIIDEKNSREIFNMTLEKLHRESEIFFAAVSEHNFSVGNIYERNCVKCNFSKICRTRFQVEGEKWN